MSGDYTAFLASKRQLASPTGIAVAPDSVNPRLFGFQRDLVRWSLHQGRAAIFADCGLGKTPIQLEWAQHVVRQSGRPVLVLAPLAVAEQTVREAEKFGIDAQRSRQGEMKSPIVVTNYERLHLFDPSNFAGVVCDESSILKAFDGVRRAAITEFMRTVPYRLLCTATAAPNDYIELGTSSEALGHLGYTDMLTRFFVNDQHTVRPMRPMPGNREMLWRKVGEWRFKGHAEQSFWRWVASWARACRRPSDLGYNDDGFVLPALTERETVIAARKPRPGMLFDVPAVGMAEEREVRRRTIAERCEAAAAMVHGPDPAVVWCHLNDEGDLLARLIPDGQQVSGADSDDAKEEKFENFRRGVTRVLIIKPKIGAFGLNWQHCAHVVYFPSDSYEQYYQAVRRCWRFGQTREVVVDLVMTDAQERVMENLRRKAAAADRMFSDLVAHMNEAIALDGRADYDQEVKVPTWL